MHAHTSFTLTFSSLPEENKKQIEDFMSRPEYDLGDVKIDNNEFKIEETYGVVFIEDVITFMKAIAKLSPDSAFTAKGCVDTSESAGEYMDFEITFKDMILTAKYSEWYTRVGPWDYDSSEEFLEEHGEKYDEEKYKELLSIGKMYALERDVCDRSQDELVAEVPLDFEETYHI